MPRKPKHPMQPVRQRTEMNGHEMANAHAAADLLTERMRKEFPALTERNGYTPSTVQSMARRGQIDFVDTGSQYWYKVEDLMKVTLMPQFTGKPRGLQPKNYTAEQVHRAVICRLETTIHAAAEETGATQPSIIKWTKRFLRRAVDITKKEGVAQAAQTMNIDQALLEKWLQIYAPDLIHRIVIRCLKTSIHTAASETGASHASIIKWTQKFLFDARRLAEKEGIGQAAKKMDIDQDLLEKWLEKASFSEPVPET